MSSEQGTCRTAEGGGKRRQGRGMRLDEAASVNLVTMPTKKPLAAEVSRMTGKGSGEEQRAGKEGGRAAAGELPKVTDRPARAAPLAHMKRERYVWQPSAAGREGERERRGGGGGCVGCGRCHP